MREDAFRAYLSHRYSASVASSIMACARRVERVLRLDLDEYAHGDARLATLPATLRAAGVPPKPAAGCATAARRYTAFNHGENAAPCKQTRPAPMPPPPRPSFIANASVAELMRLYADVLEELRGRGVTRTANGPVGDYAEMLFARAFKWSLAGNSAAAYDAVDDAGGRIQIKGRRAIGTGGRQLGAIRRLPEAGFDVLAAVLFDRNMQVFRAALIPYRTVVSRARRVEHTNSWRFMLSDDVWSLPSVRDATDALRAAERSL